MVVNFRACSSRVRHTQIIPGKFGTIMLLPAERQVPSWRPPLEKALLPEPELLRWVRRAESKQAAKWRITHFLKHAAEYAADSPLLESVRGALASFERHLPRILHRWHSLHTNARLEGFNGLFQAARARARGYRNVENFITMVYLIAAPIQVVVAS